MWINIRREYFTRIYRHNKEVDGGNNTNYHLICNIVFISFFFLKRTWAQEKSFKLWEYLSELCILRGWNTHSLKEMNTTRFFFKSIVRPYTIQKRCDGMRCMPRVNKSIYSFCVSLTCGLLPNYGGGWNTLSLTMQGNLTITFNAHIAGLDDPTWWNCTCTRVITFNIQLIIRRCPHK